MNRAFSLAGLLRVRELQEERAAAELAKANQLREAAQRQREALEQALATRTFPCSIDDLGGEIVGHDLTPNPSTWRAVVAARASAVELLRESTLVIAKAHHEVQEATDEWSQAKMRAAMIHKLKDKHLQAVEAEELREEQLVLDEAAQRRSLEVQS